MKSTTNPYNTTHTHTQSFTLIELLVVIVIIGILSGLVVIATSSFIEKANFAKAQAFSSTIHKEMLSSLVSEWTFDELTSDGKTKDTWGSNHGTVHGAEWVDDCVFGKCYSFDGVDDYIEILNFPKKNEELTLSIWVNQFAIKNGARILGNDIAEISLEDRRYRLRVYGSGGNTFYILSDVDNPELNTKKWIYIVATINLNNDQVKGYVNGITRKTHAGIRTDLFSSGTVVQRIGKYSSGANFNGLIDDVRIYDLALSSAQIKQNYIAGLDSMLRNGTLSKTEYNERLEALASKVFSNPINGMKRKL